MDSPFSALPAYAELFAFSNFTFLHGASHGEELVMRASQLGYSGLAITDECSLAGVVRAHVQAKEEKLPLIIGSYFQLVHADKRRRLRADSAGAEPRWLRQPVRADHARPHARSRRAATC